MGFHMAPVDLNVVTLEAFGALLFEELEVVVVCEVSKGPCARLWGVPGREGADIVNVHGDRPLLERVFPRQCVCVPEGTQKASPLRRR